MEVMDGAHIMLHWLTQPAAAAGFLFGVTFALTLCMNCYDYNMLGKRTRRF